MKKQKCLSNQCLVEFLWSGSTWRPLTFSLFCCRCFRSVSPASSIVRAGTVSVAEAEPEGIATSPSSEADNVSLKHLQVDLTSDDSDAAEQGNKSEFQDFRAQNRRLLPNLKNPLHVIDGPEQRYFIGIIDIFTVYSFKKRLEHWWKSLRHPGRSFSTVSPQSYCVRLCHWVQDHTK